jgi:hypothetical protein
MYYKHKYDCDTKPLNFRDMRRNIRKDLARKVEYLWKVFRLVPTIPLRINSTDKIGSVKEINLLTGASGIIMAMFSYLRLLDCETKDSKAGTDTSKVGLRHLSWKSAYEVKIKEALGRCRSLLAQNITNTTNTT